VLAAKLFSNDALDTIFAMANDELQDSGDKGSGEDSEDVMDFEDGESVDARGLEREVRYLFTVHYIF
jgi:hypothetical protein